MIFSKWIFLQSDIYLDKNECIIGNVPDAVLKQYPRNDCPIYVIISFVI